MKANIFLESLNLSSKWKYKQTKTTQKKKNTSLLKRKLARNPIWQHFNVFFQKVQANLEILSESSFPS